MSLTDLQQQYITAIEEGDIEKIKSLPDLPTEFHTWEIDECTCGAPGHTMGFGRILSHHADGPSSVDIHRVLIERGLIHKDDMEHMSRMITEHPDTEHVLLLADLMDPDAIRAYHVDTGDVKTATKYNMLDTCTWSHCNTTETHTVPELMIRLMRMGLRLNPEMIPACVAYGWVDVVAEAIRLDSKTKDYILAEDHTGRTAFERMRADQTYWENEGYLKYHPSISTSHRRTLEFIDSMGLPRPHDGAAYGGDSMLTMEHPAA